MGKACRSGFAALVLATLLGVWGIVAPMAFAGELEAAPLTYDIDGDGNATVIACDYDAIDVVIPEEVDGHPVVAIGEEAFDSHDSLESVSIPASVARIDDYAFWGCTALESVNLEASANLPLGVFQDCESLTSISIPEGVESIGEEAFSGCTALASVELPDTLMLIDCEAFLECEALVELTLPASLTCIGHNAFKDCYLLESVKFGDGLVEMGSGAFSNCEALTSVRLPDSVAEMGAGVFSGCISLASASLPSQMPAVAEWTFSGCTALASIELPAACTAIGESAFDGCASLASLELPPTIATLGPRAFAGCASIASLDFPALEGFGEGAFAQCDALASVNLGTKIDAVPANAFYSCDSLERVTLPATVRSIGYQAFDSCTKLTRVNIPKGAEAIAGCAFRNCSSLVYLGIPSSVASIGIAAFQGMSNPSTLYVTTQGQLDLLKWQAEYLDIGRTDVVLVDEDAKVTISRVSGETASETAAKISQVAFADGCRTAILARDDDFADAMSATGLAGTLGAPIILTNRYQLSPAARDELSRLGVRQVIVVGGPGAIKGAVIDGLSEVRSVTKTTRVYGESSWDTSVACAHEIEANGGNKGQACIVAMSSNFQDALSISSFAYKYGVPILLEDQSRGTIGELPAEARRFVKDLAGVIYVPGGPGAVPEDTVEGEFAGRTIVRMYGEDGYDTSVRVATCLIDSGLLDPKYAYFACGAQAPRGVDALAGAALAGKNGGPMLLLNGNPQIEAVNLLVVDDVLGQYALNVQRIAVLGGNYVMPASVIAHMEGVLGAAQAASHPDFGW